MPGLHVEKELFVRAGYINDWADVALRWFDELQPGHRFDVSRRCRGG
jgi:hypothetical protein